MSYLVFDIETVGKSYEEFDKKSKDIFKEWAERDSNSEEEFKKALEQIKEGLPFSPFLGEIVSIATIDDEGRGGVYFQAPEENIADYEIDGVKYRVGSEKDIVERFWDIARHYNRFVTFNGRAFDVPYLVVRAAVHSIKPSRDLMSNRYLSLQRGAQHVDLADQLTFYGAVRRMPKLHFAAKAFGIESPKQDDMDGKEVPKAFRDKRYKEIAEYNFADVVATRALYEKWNEYFNI